MRRGRDAGPLLPVTRELIVQCLETFPRLDPEGWLPSGMYFTYMHRAGAF